MNKDYSYKNNEENLTYYINVTYSIFLQNFVVMYVKYFLNSKHRKEKPHIIILVTLEMKNSILHILISCASAENIMLIPHPIISQFVICECRL